MLFRSQNGNDLSVDYRWATGKEKINIFDMPVKATLKKGEYQLIFPTAKWQNIGIKNMNSNEFKVAAELYCIAVSVSPKK